MFLGAIRVLNRRELVGENLRQALNSLAVVDPDWLPGRAPLARFDRYGHAWRTTLPRPPRRVEALAATIGADGRQLLQVVGRRTDLPWLREVPAVRPGAGLGEQLPPTHRGPLRWRAVQERAFSRVIAFTYDPSPHSTKRGLAWVGYKSTHRTCEDGQAVPHYWRHDHAGDHPDCVMAPSSRLT